MQKYLLDSFDSFLWSPIIETILMESFGVRIIEFTQANSVRPVNTYWWTPMKRRVRTVPPSSMVYVNK